VQDWFPALVLLLHQHKRGHITPSAPSLQRAPNSSDMAKPSQILVTGARCQDLAGLELHLTNTHAQGADRLQHLGVRSHPTPQLPRALR